MKINKWMDKRGLSYSDLFKICLSMGFLTVFVIVMTIGAIGALVS